MKKFSRSSGIPQITPVADSANGGKAGKAHLLLLMAISVGIGLFFMEGLFSESKTEIKLPLPQKKSSVSVEEALVKRRSVREYKDEALTLEEISQLLWAACGITSGWGGRTAPSGGALYPLEIYLVVGKVKGLETGVYHYRPRGHFLTNIVQGDKRFALFNAGLWQSPIKNAPVSLVICAEYPRTTQKYGERGRRYVLIEVGHVGQNIYLQAETLGLATVAIGAFSDEIVKKVLGIKEEPLYIMPVGRKR